MSESALEIELAKPDMGGDDSVAEAVLQLEASYQAQKLHLLCFLFFEYLVQGFMSTYLVLVAPVYLEDEGISISMIGLAQVIGATPFILKVFIGLFLDRYVCFNMGHRKPPIVIGMAGLFTSALLLAFVKPSKTFAGYIVISFFAWFFNSLADVANDGLVVEVIPDIHAGFVQGVMATGRALGLIGSSIILGGVMDSEKDTRYQTVFLILAGSCLPSLILSLFLRPELKHLVHSCKTSALGAKEVILHQSGLALIAFLYVGAIPFGGAALLWSSWLEDEYNRTEKQLGLYSATLAMGMLLGGVVYGWLCKRPERLPWLFASIAVFKGIGLLVLGYVPTASAGYFALFIVGIAASGDLVVVQTTIMLRAPATSVSAFYAGLVAPWNAGFFTGQGLFGWLAEDTYYPTLFAVMAGITVISGLIIPKIFTPLPSREIQL